MKGVCVAVFMSTSAILVAAVPGQAATIVPTPTGVELTVSSVPGTDSTDPHVSGDLAAYTAVSTTSSIHYQNLMSGVDSTIPNGGAFDFLSDIDNGQLVFSRSVPGTNGAVFLFDTSTPSVAPRELSPRPRSARDEVTIGGNTVAWQDFTDSPNAQLMVYDLATGITTALTNDSATMFNLTPDVSPDGTVVTWVKCQPDGQTGCQVWDATRDTLGVWTSRELTFGSLPASHPSTNGLIVVYALGAAGTTGTVRYQAVGGGPEQTVNVPLPGVTEVNPSISGDLVAFDLYTTAGSSSVWVADLLAGTVYQVSPVAPQPTTLADISLSPGGTVNVVWQVYENGKFDLHGFRYLRQVTPQIMTSATASVSLGGTIADTATFSGGIAPTGTITFDLIGPTTGPCSGPAVFTSIKPVSGNGSYTSDPFTPVLAGTYQWFTAYSGDANNYASTTACKAPDETSTVTKASPRLTTLATTSALNGSGTISDTATLSGGSAPSGTITIDLFGPNDATCSRAPIYGSSQLVNGNGNYTLNPYAAVLPGTYRWVASYSGDGSNNSATTACNDPGETSNVTKASPTITTQATASANTISTISDTAAISGINPPPPGIYASSAITFNLYGPDNGTCSGAPVFHSVKTVTGNGNYTSDPFTPALPGTYRWVASFSGNFWNNTAASACNDPTESSAVTLASPIDLSTVVGQLRTAGCIDNAKIANSLTAKLEAAQTAIKASKVRKAIGILNAFIHQVQAQSARHILASCTVAGKTVNPASVLIADARSIIDGLGVSATGNLINDGSRASAEPAEGPTAGEVIKGLEARLVTHRRPRARD